MADRGEHRQTAGAIAEALIAILLGKTNAAILDFLLKGDSGAAMTENWFIARLRNFGPIEWFTLVLCVVGYVQYLAFVQSESAFVFPAGLEFTDPLGAETAQPILLDIDIANSGKSAATITEFVAFVAHELPERPNYEQTGLNQVRTGIAPVPAAGKIRQSLRFSDWGQETMLAVKSGTRGFYPI